MDLVCLDLRLTILHLGFPIVSLTPFDLRHFCSTFTFRFYYSLSAPQPASRVPLSPAGDRMRFLRKANSPYLDVQNYGRKIGPAPAAGATAVPLPREISAGVLHEDRRPFA
jgi:hypothetical protein